MEPQPGPTKHPSTDYIIVGRVNAKAWGWTRYSEENYVVSASGVEHKTRKEAEAEALLINPTIDEVLFA